MSFEQLADAAQEAMAAAGVPGVALGLSSGEEEQYAAFGVTSLENPLPVTPGTLFQIGSITKTFTATVAMQLVDEGLLDLDAPVRTYLPSLRLGDEAAAAGATMRHLLTHTGGWEGDYFDDPSRGDDALALMVDRLADLPQVVPLGAIFSYNNAGFYIAGRVLEVIGGEPFERLVEERILRALALDETYFFAEDVMTHRFAAGHQEADGDEGTVVEVARPWQLPGRPNAAAASRRRSATCCAGRASTSETSPPGCRRCASSRRRSGPASTSASRGSWTTSAVSGSSGTTADERADLQPADRALEAGRGRRGADERDARPRGDGRRHVEPSCAGWASSSRSRSRSTSPTPRSSSTRGTT